MLDIIGAFSEIRIIPAVKFTDPVQALPTADALADGGLPCIEVMFRSRAAQESIARIADERKDILVGAGTVLTVAQAESAIAAGAQFIVAPGLNPDIAAYCLKREVPYIPGINNPFGIEQAMALGINAVKFFPAEASGGVKMLKALSAPYCDMKFLPTGGIGADNLLDYLALPSVFACGGSWVAPDTAIADGDYRKIRDITRCVCESLGTN